jgi:hypothetical protein
MSTNVPGSDVETSRTSSAEQPLPGKHKRRRLLAATSGVLLVAAGGAAVAIVDPFSDQGRSSGSARQPAPTALATVREGPLSSQVNQSGTLSYTAEDDGSPYPVVNHATGIYTSLPRAGKEVKCGDVLYRVGDTPVVLLCGSTPAYRTLSEGDSGRDVRELNKNLRRLDYAGSSEIDSDSDDFDAETEEALLKLQDDIGADETGRLELGDAVVLPGPLRITRVTAKRGTRGRPGAQLAEATSTSRQVTVDLNPAQQADVKVGDRAEITLPDNRTTPGKVTRIGSVAQATDDEGSESGTGSSDATIPVYVTLRRPKDAGDLDQAPVQVQITTDGVKRALIVPVTALVGQAGGGYAVEKVDSRRAHIMVPVTLGLFDNSNGLVQVTGALAEGDQVVVPAT